jgi:diguanylate cyclase (GGDEF)-like protein
MKFAERLKTNVENYKFVFNNTEIKVTISIGITGVGLNDTIDSLLARVDEALYEAKRKGRNRVEYR